MQCLIKSGDDASIQFLYDFNIDKDTVEALIGKYINRLKQAGQPAVPKQKLSVTFTGKNVSHKKRLAVLRIPYSDDGEGRAYTASNEPFVIFKT